VIFRKKKSRDYIDLANSLLQDARLSWASRGLAAYLLSLPKDWVINIVDLMRRSPNLRRDGLRRLMAELEAAGYLIRRPRHGDGGRIVGMDYDLYEVPPGPEVPEPTARPQCNVPPKATKVDLPPPDGISPESWAAWLRHRQSLHAPMTPDSYPRFLTELQRICAASGASPEEIIDRSIAAGYKAIVAPYKTKAADTPWYEQPEWGGRAT